jgi:hypothetical protein
VRNFFRENAKALRFDALIDKEEFMYKSEDGHNTPYNSTQEKETNLGEQLAHTPGSRVRPFPRLSHDVVE